MALSREDRIELAERLIASVPMFESTEAERSWQAAVSTKSAV